MKRVPSYDLGDDDKDTPLYFGKKKKNLHETCSCLLVSTIGYLQNPEHPKVIHQRHLHLNVQKKHKYEKYMQRIKDIMNGTNKYIQGTPENRFR